MLAEKPASASVIGGKARRIWMSKISLNDDTEINRIQDQHHLHIAITAIRNFLQGATADSRWRVVVCARNTEAA